MRFYYQKQKILICEGGNNKPVKHGNSNSGSILRFFLDREIQMCLLSPGERIRRKAFISGVGLANGERPLGYWALLPLPQSSVTASVTCVSCAGVKGSRAGAGWRAKIKDPEGRKAKFENPWAEGQKTSQNMERSALPKWPKRFIAIK